MRTGLKHLKSGSRQQRLSNISAEFVRLGDEYINELPTRCKKIMLSICKTFNNIREDYEEKYSEDYRRNLGIKPEDLSGIKGINSIEFIHYTKADKIIQEIKKLYCFLHSELFKFNN